jgi:hypothetical protein
MVRPADLAAADEVILPTNPKRRIETMKMMRIMAVLLLIAYSGAMLGCGGGTDVKQQTTTTTLGKELQDLDDAYKKGLLSESEYKESRKNLMKKYND